MAIKIFIHLPQGNGAYNYYRIVSPIAHCKIALTQERIELKTSEELDLDSDIIILHGMPDAYQWPNVQKMALNSDLYWSVDDAMFDVPETNPCHNLITITEKEIMKRCLEISKGIICTTPTVANYYKHPEKSFICPNLIDLTHYGTPKHPKQIKRIGWIAGNSHYPDANIIQDLPKLNPDKQFIFFSLLPESLARYERSFDTIKMKPNLPNVGYVPTYPINRYHKVCKCLQLDCGLAPLHNNLFNSCKSALKWKEYSALGIPTIASNCPPYNSTIKNGETGLLVDNMQDWNDAINSINTEISVNAFTEIEEKWSWQAEPSRNIWLNTFREMARKTT